MSNDYNENELDDEFVIEYHDNESILANMAWQEFKRVCLKYIDIYSDDTIKHFLKGMILDGIKEIRKDDPESITAMNIDATALSLLIGATHEVIGTGLLEKHDADNMSDFVNKCTQEQIKKGYRRSVQKEQSKSRDNNVKAICENCAKLVFQNYTLCEKCLKKKKAWATFGVIIAFLIFDFTFACFTYYVAISFNLNSYSSLGSLFWCLLLPHLIKKARAKVDEKYKLNESDKTPIIQPKAPAPAPVSPIPPDIQFPKYTEEQNKGNERDKLLNRISELYRENEELKKRKPKKAFIAVIVILSVLLVSVTGFAVYQQIQIQDLYSQNKSVNSKLKEEKRARLNAEIREAENKKYYDFYVENAVCIYSSGPYSSYYHKAECEWFQNSDRYRILNKRAAINNGYSPCPDCFG